MSESLTDKVVKGFNWSALNTLVNTFVQIAYTSIMARLLVPSDFGLMAISMLFLNFGNYFSHMGMGNALIQKKELTSYEIRAGFTFNFLFGSFFFLVFLVIAPYSRYMLDNDKVINVVRVMALSFLISGFFSTCWSLQQRRMDFAIIAKNGIITKIFGQFVPGIVFAALDYGVWSLVYTNLLQLILFGVFSYVYVRHSLLFIFQWKHYKSLLSYGSKISIISFLEFINSNVDTLVIGKLFGSKTLGIYNRGYELVKLPSYYLQNSFINVLFPAFSQIQDEREKLKKAYMSASLLIGYLMFPMCFGIAAAAEQIVLVLLGNNWSEGIILLRIMALEVAFRYHNTINGVICEATDTLKPKIYLQFIQFVLIIILYFIFSYYLQIIGLLLAVFIITIFTLVYYYVVLIRLLGLSLKNILDIYQPCLFTAFCAYTLIYSLAVILNYFQLSQLIILIIQVMAGGMLLLLLMKASPNKIIKNRVIELLQNSLSDESKGFVNTMKKRLLLFLSPAPYI